MKHALLSFLLFALFSAGYSQSDLVKYVDPFIGTGGHGHTYPGASVPFGMVQLSPDTRLEGWDGCSGYHASDSVIYGFSHTHLSGTGCSDYGDILLMPAAREVSTINYDYASSFDAASETAEPGYYSVRLTANRVLAELSATTRAGMHRYTFESGPEQNLVLDLKHRDQVLGSGIRIVSRDEIEGYRISKEWAENQMIYFVVKFSRPFETLSMEAGDELMTEVSAYSGDNIRVVFRFSAQDGNELLVKVGISGVSVEGARLNLENEIPGWDFEQVRKDAADAWEAELGKIRVTGGTPGQMTNFYTALYHVMLAPNIYMDVDWKYRGRDLQVHQSQGFRNYTVFSLWDTYRALHPLLTIIDRRRTGDFINTFLQQYEEGGLLPVWELSANETNCMIGYHAVPVIVDAWVKGVRGFDEQKALEAMKTSAGQEAFGLKFYREYGYIPGDKEGESVSRTLEYAYDDWCIAQFAKGIGQEETYREFISRAQYYKNLFNPATGFMQAKHNSTWVSPFDPYEVNFNYTEANSWQYSFYVPQDVEGMIALMGGPERFAIRLDSLFMARTSTTGRNQADITGLIGQYAHGNEPSHHMAYLYNYAGQPWKTQELVGRICREFYKNDRDGLIGNEDCGQMSAWYVFSALGFYPVTPGSDHYAIGTPLFREAVIRLESGKVFTIKSNRRSETDCYIQSATLNGIPWTKSYLLHSDLMAGGELVFKLGPRPNHKWGSGTGDLPLSAIRENLVLPVPAFTSAKAAFMDSTVVAMNNTDSGAVIRYTTDGTDPGPASPVYSGPFPIFSTTTVKAVAMKNGFPDSFTISATFKKIPQNRTLKLAFPYAPQYPAGGDLALIDLNRGGENFRTGGWQGFEGVDLVAVVDLGNTIKINKIEAGFLQDQKSWIFFPDEIDFQVSMDGKSFVRVAVTAPETVVNDPAVRVMNFAPEFEPVAARYVKVVARNVGNCPPWHPGAGSKAWLFVDEIIVE